VTFRRRQRERTPDVRSEQALPSRFHQSAMSSHSIQLRAPWAMCQPAPLTPPAAPLPPLEPTPFPALFPAVESVRLIRSFHCPSGLTPADSVHVVLVAEGRVRAVWLGSTPLTIELRSEAAASPPARLWQAELTRHLSPSNQLAIDLIPDPADPALGCALREVRLEITPAW